MGFELLSYVFTCPRCGGTGKEHIKAGPLSTQADCMKCLGKGSFATQNCNFVSSSFKV